MNRTSRAARAVALVAAAVAVLAGTALTWGSLGGGPTAPGTGSPQNRPEPVSTTMAPPARAAVEAVNNGTVRQAAGVVMTTPAPVDPEQVVDELSMLGGCVPGYGRGTACLPAMPPRLAAEHAGHQGMRAIEMARYWTCPEVRDLIPDGIAVNDTPPPTSFPGAAPGRDPLRLDSNGDGVACGRGDT